MLRSSIFFLLSFACLNSALAFVKLEGYFIAQKTCEAFQSKNKQTNPGNIITHPRTAYVMLGINKADGNFFQVEVPDAPVTTSRWVNAACGVHVVRADTRTGAHTGNNNAVALDRNGTESTDNLLTLSWQPAFCETRPGKTECRDLNDGNLPHTTRQLSIHGLWPQPRGNDYCGVPASVKDLDTPDNWHRLPAPEIDQDTADALQSAMPGFASFLHNHEWIKHGTCYFGEGGADEYYDDTLYLTGLVNDSAVGDLFFDNVGEEITGAEIRAAFDASFGSGSGDRVQIRCTPDAGRTLINEIWISLSGTITPTSDLGELMRAANPTAMDCLKGVVDAAGLQ